MGTTPIYGLPYPEATDFVTDGAAAIQALAEDTETQLATGTAYDSDRLGGVAAPMYQTAAQASAAYAPIGAIMARGAQAAAQSLPTGVTTAIEMTAETDDTHGFHDNATFPSRFTVPAGRGGRYVVTGVVSFASNGTGAREAQLRINGVAAEIVSHQADPSAFFLTRVGVTGIFTLAAGDFVEVFATQSSGGALNTDPAYTTLALAHLGT